MSPHLQWLRLQNITMLNNDQQTSNLKTFKVRQYSCDNTLQRIMDIVSWVTTHNPWSSLTQSVVNEPELVLSLDEEGSLVSDVREE